MFRLLLLLAAVTLAAAQTRCCFPPKLHMEVGQNTGMVTNGQTTVSAQFGSIDADFNMGLLSFQYIDTTTQAKSRIIFDGRNNVTYGIFGPTCIKSASTAPLSGCIPPTAKYLMTGVMGFGAETITYTAWELEKQFLNQTQTQIISFSEKNCAYLGATIKGQGKVPGGGGFDYMTSQGMFNLTSTPNPDMLKIPDICTGASLQPHDPEVITRAKRHLAPLV